MLLLLAELWPEAEAARGGWAVGGVGCGRGLLLRLLLLQPLLLLPRGVGWGGRAMPDRRCSAGLRQLPGLLAGRPRPTQAT